MAQKDFGPTSDLGPTGRSIHTKFYTPAANKNDCDMGIVHSYRYVNTEGMYGMLSGSKAYTVDVGDYPLDFYLDFCTRQQDSEGTTNYFYNNVNIHFTNINEGPTVHTLKFTPRPNYEFCDMGESHRYRNVNTLYMYRVNTTYQTSLRKIYDVCNNISTSDPLLYFAVYDQGIEGKHLEDLNGEIPYSLEIEFTNLPTYKSGYSSDVTLSSGSKFQINAKDYFPNTFNIVAASTAHTTIFDATPYPNNSQVLMGDYHSHKYVNTLGLYKMIKHSIARAEMHKDLGSSLLSGPSSIECTQSTNTKESFYEYATVYLTNLPTTLARTTDVTISPGGLYHIAEGSFFPYAFNVVASASSYPSTSAGPSVVLDGYTYYRSDGYKTLIEETGTMPRRSAADITIEAPKTYEKGYYPAAWTVTPSGSGGVSVNSKIPLLSTESRIGTSASWNALLPYNGNIYNQRLANGYIAKSGLGLHCNFGGEGPYKSEALSYFINTSYSTPLTGTRLYFMNSSYLRFSKHPYGLITNSTGNRFGLYINHTGWYEIEFGSWMPTYDEYLNTAYNGNFVIYNTVSQIKDSKFEGLTSYAYRVAFNNDVSTHRLKVDTTGKSSASGAASSHFFLTVYLYAGSCIRTQLALGSTSSAVHTYFRLYLYENSKSGLVT